MTTPTQTRTARALIDINEAAERLGVSARFVRRLVAERRISFHKIGKYVRFDPEDIDAFVQAWRVEASHSR